MLHEHDQPIFEDLKEIMGDERIEVQLDAKIKWMGHYYRYPLQFGDMVRHMSLFRLAHYGLALVWSQIRFKLFPREPRDAEEALVQLYGGPLYEFFFKEFTHRYWGIPSSGLSAGFIKSKMPRLSAVDLIKKALAKAGIKEKHGQAVESALLEETLHYSRNGSEALPRLLAGRVAALGGEVLLGGEVAAVETAGGKVVAVRTRGAAGERVIPCDFCINTIPVNTFARAFAPAAPPEVLAAAARLRYKAIAIYGVLVRRERCLDACYIYYRRRIFHRVGEPKNGGLQVTPEGHTVLIVEMTCDVGDIWKR
jgi:protoporphyrinogen oxidase